MSESCFLCHQGPLTSQRLDYVYPFAGFDLVHRVEGLKCGRCGEEFFNEHVVKGVERASPCFVLSARPATDRVLRDVRAHLGLTLPDLAHLLDIADATLSRYEDGSETAPQTVTLALLALCLRAHAGQALEGALEHLGVRFAQEEGQVTKELG